MTGPRHTSFPELVDWVEGGLSAERAQEVAAQFDVEPGLHQDVAWIRNFVATGREAPLVLPPDDVRRALRAMFRERRGCADHPVRLLLLFDSRRDRAATGVRALDTRSNVQLAYTGEAVDLVLDVHDGSHDTVRIDGQLFLRAGQAAVDEVSVRSADGSTRTASGGDPLGRFMVDGVPAGPVRLEVRAGGVEVMVDADLCVAQDET